MFSLCFEVLQFYGHADSYRYQATATLLCEFLTYTACFKLTGFAISLVMCLLYILFTLPFILCLKCVIE